MPRFFCPTPLITGTALTLPAGAGRHVQVLRLQPGDAITLFNGQAPGGEFDATVTHMGRSDVQVQVGAHHSTEREPTRQVHLAVGMPANDRMDWLVEKATELGVTSIQPLMSERSVLRLAGERADKKVAHWQSVAVSACEQCGGNRVPTIHAMQSLAAWLKALSPTEPTQRMLLSLAASSTPLRPPTHATTASHALCFLSGPEGGLSPTEEAAAIAAGFAPTSLGPRVLRSETAALAALTLLTLSS
jgi:16S rRNA (uracil1498-N3)-methyltransferase